MQNLHTASFVSNYRSLNALLPPPPLHPSTSVDFFINCDDTCYSSINVLGFSASYGLVIAVVRMSLLVKLTNSFFFYETVVLSSAGNKLFAYVIVLCFS